MNPLFIPLWRQRQDLRRAEMDIAQRCMARCRQHTKGDKEEAARIWKQLERMTAPPASKVGAPRKPIEPQDPVLTMTLQPFLSALTTLNISAAAIEKELTILARAEPLWKEWVVNVRGVGELAFAGMMAEAGRPLTDYHSVKAFWKRFGLAVIDGERQRKVKGSAEIAEMHGFAPTRRVFSYNVGSSLMRQQKLLDPYRMIYDERRAYEEARGINAGHSNKRAQRHMTKAFFRDAWVKAKELSGEPS